MKPSRRRGCRRRPLLLSRRALAAARGAENRWRRPSPPERNSFALVSRGADARGARQRRRYKKSLFQACFDIHVSPPHLRRLPAHRESGDRGPLLLSSGGSQPFSRSLPRFYLAWPSAPMNITAATACCRWLVSTRLLLLLFVTWLPSSWFTVPAGLTASEEEEEDEEQRAIPASLLFYARRSKLGVMQRTSVRRQRCLEATQLPFPASSSSRTMRTQSLQEEAPVRAVT